MKRIVENIVERLQHKVDSFEQNKYFDIDAINGAITLLKEQDAQLKEWEKYTGFLASHGMFEMTIVPIERID